MKILVVEDEKDLNRLICKELESDGYVVDYCYDGASAFDYLSLGDYDGAILDVMLPVMDGFEVLRRARKEGITIPILFLSAKGDIKDIVNGLDTGADDYMVKPFHFQELLARVRVMVRKKVDVHENIYCCGDLVMDCNTHQVWRGEREIELSPKEYSVLLYLIRNQNIVVTRDQIEANIWDSEQSGYSNVIDVYIRYLRKKIDNDEEYKMIQTVRGVGYILRGQ